MKVALLVPGGVDRGGTERVIPALLWLIERLARRHEVHVFALRQEPRPAAYDLLGARVHVLGARPRRLRALLGLMEEHRRGPFGVIHALWAAPQGAIAAAAGRLLGAGVLLHLAGGELASIPDIGYGLRRTVRGRAWLRLAVRGADRIIVPSEPMRAAAAALGIASERVPWGVALDRWPPSPPRRRDPGEPARLLFVGSLNRVKDLDTLLRAAALLRDAVDFRLDVVGTDTLEGAVQARAVALGLGERTNFHGFLPQDALRPVVERAHLLLVSSRHEAGPVVVREAAAAGVPAVGTRVGTVAEWAPGAALAVEPGDADALAEATRALLLDEDRRLDLARAAQARATDEDADRTAARIVEIYDELAALRASSERSPG